MTKTLRLVSCGFLLLVLCHSASASFFHKKSAAPAADNRQVIASAIVKSTTWSPRVSVVGDIAAVQGVNLSTEVSGIVSKINFHSGQTVEAGQSLLELSHEDLSADVENDKAQLDLAKRNYQRYQELYKKGIVSKDNIELDDASAKVEEAQASLDRDQALLNQKIITAPFAGRIGIRQVNLGQYLSPGDSVVSLQRLKPIYVDFNVPENSLSGIAVGSTVQVSVVTDPKKHFTGKIAAIGTELDNATRSLGMRAKLKNEAGELLPGMYVNVAILLPVVKNVLIIPQNSVVYNSYGNSVYKIVDGKVTQQYVDLGERYGNNVIITKGLQAGDEVVTAGQNKLYEGAAVKVDNTVSVGN